MSADKFVVITSVHEPNDCVRTFAKWEGWQVVVVGDRKTPESWKEEPVQYLSLDEQAHMFPELALAIPEDTYLRKMIGYAYAIRGGATAIFETDDDNSPYPDAEKTVSGLGRGDRLRSLNGWVNTFCLLGASKSWPRGFPLELVRPEYGQVVDGESRDPWAIAQFMADGDPDLDAIGRMAGAWTAPITFRSGENFVLDPGTYSPINSQATLWTIEAFPLMFLPLGVSDRVTDILRGYIAQACLWKAGRAAAFASPIVMQNRNEHDLIDDFRQEVPLYLNAAAWCKRLLDVKGETPAAAYRSAIEIMSGMRAIPYSNMAVYETFLDAAGLK